MAEAEIAKADFVEHFEFRGDFGDVDEKGEGFTDGHLENVVNAFAVVVNFEDGGFVARAAALFADEFNVGEELHFDGDGTVALTGFAATAGNVERKMTCGIAMTLGVGRIGEDFADGVEGFHVRGGIRTRRTADGRLVDDDDFLD